jgi:hypothetical protein
MIVYTIESISKSCLIISQSFIEDSEALLRVVERKCISLKTGKRNYEVITKAQERPFLFVVEQKMDLAYLNYVKRVYYLLVLKMLLDSKRKFKENQTRLIQNSLKAYSLYYTRDG